MTIKDKSIAIPKDATTVIADRQSSIGRRSEPRLVEMSIVETNCIVQHPWNAECGANFGTTHDRAGWSRFRVRHNLTSVPNVVHLMRVANLNTEDTSGDSITRGVKIGNDDVVPDQTGFSCNVGYNRAKFDATTSSAMVLLNTTSPVADQQYSYFTAGFPVALWPVVIKGNNLGSIDAYELPEYWGNVVSASLNQWGSTPQNIGLGLAIGNAWICNPSSGSTTFTCPKEFGPPYKENRTVRGFAWQISGTTGGSPDGELVLMNVFCAPRNGMTVRVRVVSQVWEGIVGPTIVPFPGPDAHSAE